jgi:hypothetical protein
MFRNIFEQRNLKIESTRRGRGIKKVEELMKVIKNFTNLTRICKINGFTSSQILNG